MSLVSTVPEVIDYTDHVEKLQLLPSSQLWMCETVLCLKLGFTFTRENEKLPEDVTIFPSRELLSRFIHNLKFGHAVVGETRMGKIDLSDTAQNQLNLYYQKQNKIMQWKPNGDLAQNKRRVFCRYHVSIHTR